MAKENNHRLNTLDFSLFAYTDLWDKDGTTFSIKQLEKNKIQVLAQIKIIFSKLTDKDIAGYYKKAKANPASPVNNKKLEILEEETGKRKLLKGLGKEEYLTI